jgi:acetyltransferase-like isoleucine patch superfamily enzyme/acyl carrier protein
MTRDPRGALLVAVSRLRPGVTEIRDEDTLAGLGLDSLDRLALAAAVEQATGHPVTDQHLANARTIADLIRCVTNSSSASQDSATDAADPSTRELGWVDPGGQVGSGTRLWHQAQIADGAQVGDDCILGKGVYIGAGSRVGDRVKFGNGANVFGAAIADEVMICPGALLLEDPAPRATTPDGRRKTATDFARQPVTVHIGATIGAGAVLAPGVRIGAHALVAMGAIVVRDVPAYGLVAGNPARQCGWVCRCGHTLSDEHRCPACARTYTHDGTQLIQATRDEPPAAPR